MDGYYQKNVYLSNFRCMSIPDFYCNNRCQDTGFTIRHCLSQEKPGFLYVSGPVGRRCPREGYSMEVSRGPLAFYPCPYLYYFAVVSERLYLSQNIDYPINAGFIDATASQTIQPLLSVYS